MLELNDGQLHPRPTFFFCILVHFVIAVGSLGRMCERSTTTSSVRKNNPHWVPIGTTSAVQTVQSHSVRGLISFQSECDAVQSSTSICRTHVPRNSSRLEALVHDWSRYSAFDRSADNNPIVLVSLSNKTIDPINQYNDEWTPLYLCHSRIEPTSLHLEKMLITFDRRLDQAYL